MIKIKIVEKHRMVGCGNLDVKTGYNIVMDGHASEYADPDGNIVCAAVSALTSNLIASIDQLTTANVIASAAADGGYMHINIENVSEHADMLIKSWAIGIEHIRQRYGCIETRTKRKQLL